MKGTLLLLALLVTGELGFQKTEACGLYFEVYTALVLGDKILLNLLISKLKPTDGEREALNKVQECFNEAGLNAKATDGVVLHDITVSPECAKYYTKDTIEKFEQLLAPILANQ